MYRLYILIAWFLVSLTAGQWHYTGPYSAEKCNEFLDVVKPFASIAYCTEAP